MVAAGGPAPGAGSALRIGLIVPSTNTTNEAEWRRVLPPGTTLSVARVVLPRGLAPLGNDVAHEVELGRAIASLDPASAAVIAYGCTATSMTDPPGRAVDCLRALAQRPCVATAPAIVDACRALGARRVGLGTPYGPTLTSHEAAWLDRRGIGVVRVRGLGYGEPDPSTFAAIRGLSATEVAALARSVDGADVDAIVLSCTDLPTLDVVDAIERELGKPVVTSNGATLRAALAAAGYSVFDQYSPTSRWPKLSCGSLRSSSKPSSR